MSSRRAAAASSIGRRRPLTSRPSASLISARCVQLPQPGAHTRGPWRLIAAHSAHGACGAFHQRAAALQVVGEPAVISDANHSGLRVVRVQARASASCGDGRGRRRRVQHESQLGRSRKLRVAALQGYWHGLETGVLPSCAPGHCYLAPLADPRPGARHP